MPTRTPGRHRAAMTDRKALFGVVPCTGASLGPLGRRTAVIAATTTLVMSLGVTASSAEPVAPQPRPSEPVTVEVPEVPVVSAALVVPKDATVSFSRTATPDVTPPPPPPAPEPVESDDDEVVAEVASDSDEDSADDSAQQVSSSEDSGFDESGSDESGSDESSSESSSSDDSGSAPSSAAGGSVLGVAAQYVGTPYVYGGTSPSGFDCSGFVQYVFNQVGISLPRTAAQQAASGTQISRSEAQPGDLVVMDGEYHIGIYAGGNQFYDSPRPGRSVSKRDIWTSDVYFVRVTG